MSQDVILGIESSCDDTAAAVVDRDRKVLSSGIASQTHNHSHWGGVYPEFASRAHALVVVPTIEKALKEANVEGPKLKAIGVTRGPGLIGSCSMSASARFTNEPPGVYQVTNTAM